MFDNFSELFSTFLLKSNYMKCVWALVPIMFLWQIEKKKRLHEGISLMFVVTKHDRSMMPIEKIDRRRLEQKTHKRRSNVV